MKNPLIKLYTQEGLEDLWGGWCGAVHNIFVNGGNICKEDLGKIKCPTLILHGDKDPMVHPEHPEYLFQNIKMSKLKKIKMYKFAVLLLSIGVAIATPYMAGGDSSTTAAPDPDTLSYHPKSVNVPDVSYVTDAVEALKEAYLLSDNTTERAAYFIQVFNIKHKQTWGCAAKYEVFQAPVKSYIDIQVSDGRLWKIFSLN
ncbi:unnamed protein product [Brassicogethes aeneus]|uniref:Uncharacterized protein n=1 Tax=Brassicogethes aeneus TaxID=1431903 RepID=A0A9P0B4H6_BRAAE|nr:unnamed protein product [Brassicogethes aeneus]